MLRPLLTVVLLACAAYYVVVSIRWPIAMDSAIMHYVNFLMRHGMKPYTDITDNNMPGAYYTEGIAMRVFGASDLACRLYDFFLLATMTAALALIARSRDWVAGLFAGCMFLLLHGAEGPSFSVEREEVIVVLLVLGYLALFTAVERRRPALMAVLGIAGGVAASIKPTFLPLPVVLVIVAAIVLWQRRVSATPYVAWAAAGCAAVLAFDIAFLLHYHAMSGFLFIMRTVLPAYSATRRESMRHLITSFDRGFLLLVIVAIPLAIVNRRRAGAWTWQRWSIALGAAFGALSYFVQGKGFLHHRYPVVVFLLLLIGFEIFEGLRETGWPRRLAVSACALVLLWMVPQQTRTLHRVVGTSAFTTSLESDLQQLGGAHELQNKVQCFDLVYGCLNALYHLDLVENTGFTGDLLLFTDGNSAAAKFYRGKFWSLAQQDPADVLVISNEWFQRSNSYAKLDTWPEFKDYLQQNYTQVVERHFAMRLGGPLPAIDRDTSEHDSYRIYVRNGSPLQAKAAEMQ